MTQDADRMAEHALDAEMRREDLRLPTVEYAQTHPVSVEEALFIFHKAIQQLGCAFLSIVEQGLSTLSALAALIEACNAGDFTQSAKDPRAHQKQRPPRHIAPTVLPRATGPPRRYNAHRPRSTCRRKGGVRP